MPTKIRLNKTEYRKQLSRLRETLVENPFCSGRNQSDFWLWDALGDFTYGLLTAEGEWIRDILDAVDARARLANKRPLPSSIERELRGRSCTRRTVRTELEKRGWRVVCENGRVRIEMAGGE